MPKIDFDMALVEGEGYLDKQISVGKLMSRQRILARQERQLNALTKRGKQDEELEITFYDGIAQLTEDIISFLGQFVTAVDDEPADWGDAEGQRRIHWALRRASKQQIDDMMALVRGTSNVPKPSETDSSPPSEAT